MKIILPAPRNLTGVSLTGGNRKLRSLHREIQLSTALLLFRNINNMNLAVECSDNPKIVMEKRKLMGDLNNILKNLVYTFRKCPEFTSIPDVKKILKTMQYRMQKNESTKERYSSDETFREGQKRKMRQWRKCGSNAEKERSAAKRRRAKAKQWKKFCAEIK